MPVTNFYSTGLNQITKALKEPNLSKAELIGLKTSLIVLSMKCPEKDSELQALVSKVNNRISQNTSAKKLAEKLLELF